MANEVLVKVGTQILFADHSGDWAGGAAKTTLEVGTPTEVQLDLTGLTDTNGRESAKADLGATRAEAYSVMASFEFAATPTTAATVDLFWAPSPVSAAANGNPMNIDGVDAAAPSGIGTILELKSACQFIGAFKTTDDPTTAIQTGFVGTLFPSERYGMLLVVNESGAAFHTDVVECCVAFNPIIREVQ